MTKKEINSFSADTLTLYDKLIATQKDIERKGATMPYTSLNGHMFSYIGADGLVALRLPADMREDFIKKYKTKLAVAHGVVMKEYVAVPNDVLKKTTELKKYLQQSVDYIKSLKPKPTTKKSANKK